MRSETSKIPVLGPVDAGYFANERLTAKADQRHGCYVIKTIHMVNNGERIIESFTKPYSGIDDNGIRIDAMSCEMGDTTSKELTEGLDYIVINDGFASIDARCRPSAIVHNYHALGFAHGHYHILIM